MDEKPRANPCHIREMNIETDLDSVAEIWLREVKRAHLLICDKFWDSRLSVFIKETQQEATERYIWEEKGLVIGFITAKEDKDSESKAYMPELYIDSSYQRKGIGKKLLKKLQDKYSEITLSVYKQNNKAFHWYTKHDFKVIQVKHCPSTEFLKYDMIWKKKDNLA
jgi:ribosomal protein S18 acetylase RimI-like enzyme